jgi:hypothetical protein
MENDLWLTYEKTNKFPLIDYLIFIYPSTGFAKPPSLQTEKTFKNDYTYEHIRWNTTDSTEKPMHPSKSNKDDLLSAQVMLLKSKAITLGKN